MQKTFRDMNDFIKLCLDIAYIIDKKGYDSHHYFEELHTGWKVLSDGLRQGVQACICMQSMYYIKAEEAELAKVGEQEARDFLRECFGDEEIFTIGDEYKRRIREFCNNLEKEWEEKENAKK